MYYIGDKIRVKKLETMIEEYGVVGNNRPGVSMGWQPDMNVHAGKVYHIESIDTNVHGLIRYTLNGDNDIDEWVFGNDMILPDYTLIGDILNLRPDDISFLLSNPEVKEEFGIIHELLTPCVCAFTKEVNEVVLSKFYSKVMGFHE